VNGFLSLLCFVSFLFLILGLIRPQLFKNKDKEPMTRKQAGIGFGIITFILAVLVGVTSPSPKPVAASVTPTPSPTLSPSTAPKTTPKPSPVATATPKATPKVATRQVTGTAKTLGAGTFTGGKDVAVGLYEVTTTSGQSGNFIVTGTDSYNEVLGVNSSMGVPRVRTQISDGDSIQISGLSQVIFTPVTTPFATTHTPTVLYAGTFTVGEDIGQGRYVATPGAGESGNFIVSGTDSYNEILGGSSAMGGVPNITVDLTNGDAIAISGLSQVTLSPSN
jgi:hypothetical protein